MQACAAPQYSIQAALAASQAALSGKLDNLAVGQAALSGKLDVLTGLAGKVDAV